MRKKEKWVNYYDSEIPIGYYRISTLGRIRSTRKHRHHGRILKHSTNPKGYRTITLSVKGKIFYRMVHRMVAMSFIPNPNNLPEVNHKDLNKANCKKSNLEWQTKKQNHAHAVNNGRLAKKLTPNDVRIIIPRIIKGERICEIRKDYPFIGWEAIKAIKLRLCWNRIWKEFEV